MTMDSRLKTTRPQASRTEIWGLVGVRAAQSPDQPAFFEGASGRSLSWKAIAGHAQELSVQLGPPTAGRRLGLCIDGATQFCSTYIGALASGLCVAPLDPRAPTGEIRRLVAELGLTDLLLDAPMAGLAGPMLGTGIDVWCVGEQAQLRAATAATSVASVHRATVPRVNPGHQAAPAVILRSSGSTGAPKLIPLSQSQLLHGARQVVTHHRLTPRDRGYCPLPLFHINAQVVGILSTLISGGSLVVDRRLARDRFWETVESSAATWLNLVPAILSIVSEGSAPGGLSSRVRFARSASSHLAEPVRRRFEGAAGISVLDTYGMTEAAGQITANPVNPGERRPGSVGLPVGVDLRIVREDGFGVLGSRQVGIVQIKGPSVISAYLGPNGAPETVPALTSDGWLCTGDLAWQDSDGFVFLMGRTDDLINRGGEKLYPAEIESVLLADPRVLAASAVGRPHPTLGAEPVAFVVARPGLDGASGSGRLVQDLHRACSERLSFYKRPVEITVAERLPLGATGKVKRSLVEKLVVGATAR